MSPCLVFCYENINKHTATDVHVHCIWRRARFECKPALVRWVFFCVGDLMPGIGIGCRLLNAVHVICHVNFPVWRVLWRRLVWYGSRYQTAAQKQWQTDCIITAGQNGSNDDGGKTHQLLPLAARWLWDKIGIYIYISQILKDPSRGCRNTILNQRVHRRFQCVFASFCSINHFRQLWLGFRWA